MDKEIKLAEESTKYLKRINIVPSKKVNILTKLCFMYLGRQINKEVMKNIKPINGYSVDLAVSLSSLSNTLSRFYDYLIMYNIDVKRVKKEYDDILTQVNNSKKSVLLESPKYKEIYNELGKIFNEE